MAERFDEISAGDQNIGNIKKTKKQKDTEKIEKRRYKKMICMTPKSKTEGKGETPTYT